ncbi:MAG: mrdA [Deltaproteobacteria bacterium]|nr:mrdA [Deltaproteobacteria bacterium]
MNMEVYSREGVAGATTRLFTFSAIVVIGTIILLSRLWYLQILNGDDYRQKSENNRVRIRPILAARGMILDRFGKVMVDNRPAFDVFLLREDAGNLKEAIKNVSGVIKTRPEDIETSLRRESPIRPVRIKRDIDRETLATLLTNRLDLPGITVSIEPKRSYPYGNLGSHLFGHIGEVTEKQLSVGSYTDYRMGSLIGKSGLELKYETYLKGVDGGKYVEIDASGRELSILKEVDSYPGNNLVTTIDLELQKAAEEAFKDKAGAVVAMDPRNGEILAMISSPAFNPDMFSGPLDSEEWNLLINNPLKPLQNRAIQGQYPPGSTYKTIVAAAALEEGVITKDTAFQCNGSYRFGNRNYRCWKSDGHGSVSLHRAIVESCDTYFYQVGLKLGIDKIADYSRKFGLGQPTGIELSDEKSGIVPDRAWKQKRSGTPWFEGETLSCAIGQGFNLVTPIQLLTAYAALTNGGDVYQPHLAKALVGPDGKVLRTLLPEARKKLILSPETVELLKAGLQGVVNEPGGTARSARLDDIKVGGKTGTTQVVAMRADQRVKGEDLTYWFRDHAWFASFAPVEDPRIALVVFIEHSGYSGGHAAAPVAGKILKSFFDLEKQRKDGVQSEEKPEPLPAPVPLSDTPVHEAL